MEIVEKGLIDWHANPSRVISCQEVRKSDSLYVHIYISYSCFSRDFFAHAPIK